MSLQADTNTAAVPKAALMISAAIIMVGALGFFGWSAEGTNIFVSLVQAGLAWCL